MFAFAVLRPALTPPPPHLFLDQTEAQRAGKKFLESAPSPTPPPPYLKVWIRHCWVIGLIGQV